VEEEWEGHVCSRRERFWGGGLIDFLFYGYVGVESRGWKEFCE